MLETLEKKLAELQQQARQQEMALMQISGAIQIVMNLISEAKGEQNAPETRDE